MNLAISTLARRPRHHRHRTLISAPPSRGGVHRIVLRFEWLEDRTVLSTFTVTNLADSGPGSLRQAILDSDAATGGTNTIDFQIPGQGVQTIAPASPPPAITGAVLVDGWSQPGFAGTPLIELDGSQAGSADGLTVTGPDVTVRGLDIGGFDQGAGIHITGTDATGDWIYGDFLGTDPTGTQADPNDWGVEIDGGAAHNLIGTNGDGVNDTAERNLLSGNFSAGVWINGQGTDGNAVAGNFIGTSVTGDVALDNGTYPANFYGGGLLIEGGACGNRIGTDGSSVDDVGERNIISGNDFDGVAILGTGTDGNIVAGNYIGTNLTGTRLVIPLNSDLFLGGLFNGVFIWEGASANWIGVNPDGGTGVGDEGNVISGGQTSGVTIGENANANVVAGDKIGTDATGTVALGTFVGVSIDSSMGNTIGGTSALGADVISGNGYAGVSLDDSSDNIVEGDLIGTDVTGTKALGNLEGVQITTSNDNTIGGTSAGAGNLITDNSRTGVWVGQSLTENDTGDEIIANRIFGNGGQAIDLGDDGVTDNGIAPRQGPNNLQNFPIFFKTADGRLQGGLSGSLPDTTFRIDVFASASYGPGGAGEAEDYLGSLQVTTDSLGQAVFDVPYTAPADLPVITGTATDPQGNTSEVTASRTVTLTTPPPSLRAVPNRALIFSTAPGDGLAIQDPGAAPLDPDPFWSLTLSVSAGTLSLSTTAGLTGSGDGTGSLSYSGPVSALDAALDGLAFTPPAGADVYATLTLDAQSYGAPPLQTQFAITDGVFVVNTTADSGPGSLRQAILDSDAAVGAANTIDFDIPGPGIQTMELLTPLPPITNSVVIDGTTQPGFAGAPLIAFGDQSIGSPAPLAISAEDVTIRGLALDSVAIDPTTDELLIAVDDAPGSTDPLSLLDSLGNVLVQSDGISSSDPDQMLNEHLAAGDYSLGVDGVGGQGTSTLTIMLIPASAPFQGIPVATASVSIVAGDFAGNGKLDLAIADFFVNKVSILLGNGDGTFQPAVQYAVAFPPSAIVTGDFNDDGRLDLAVADGNDVGAGAVSILLGNGDGTFQPAVNYELASDPVALTAGDFNGDGRLDLAVACQSGDVSILLGNGDGTFQPARQVFVADAQPVLSAMVAGDFTGNGRPDLAVASWGAQETSGALTILLGNGDGTFQPGATYVMGPDPSSIVTGDFNDDGRLDLAVANYPYAVSVLLGNGDGTFQPPVNYGGATSPSTLVAGDFTGNGIDDLAVENTSGSVSIWLGNGDGTFQPHATYPFGTSLGSIVSGDFNGDGRIDLATTSEDVTTVSVLLGNGNGSFQPQGQTGNPVGFNPQWLVTGDFNGDGRLDLAVANSDNTVSVLLGNGDGTFAPQVTYQVGLDPVSIVAGDFNGDGRTDLAVVCKGDEEFGGGTDPGGVYVLLGNGDGTFQPAVEYPAGYSPLGIVTGDFTGDGRLDLAVIESGNVNLGGTEPGGVSLLLGNGDGTFQPQVTYAAGEGAAQPVAIAAGDFSGDGRLDLAVLGTNPATFDGAVDVFLSNGAGTFLLAGEYAVGNSPTALAMGDFTGNGRLDLAVADLSGRDESSVDEEVSVLLGNGDGTFQPARTVATGVAGPMVAGDFNGDGKLDLAVNNPADSTVSILDGNGDGTFQLANAVAAGFTGPMVAGDFAGDGQLDLAVADQASDSVLIALGNGDGTFVDSSQLAVASHANPLVADVNGDGTDDVLVVDGQGNILYRQGIPGQPGTFEPPVSVNPGFPSRDIAWVPNTDQGPLLASVDARDNAVSLYSWRDGAFVRIGSLATGTLPAQIIAADLDGTGFDDLIVRNAGDGTLFVYVNAEETRSRAAAAVFLTPICLTVGLGVSDVQAVDTTGRGLLDLVVTNKLTGQVGIVPNWGHDVFAPMEPYRAGTGLSAVDPAGTPEVTSLEATAGVAAGMLTPGGPNSLVTINPGSNTLDVLTGLGAGRFANPVTIDTSSPALAIREADFTHDGHTDLAVLTADGVSIYLGNGQGGFDPPVTYKAGTDPSGLTVADLTGNGQLDLLVGNAYGDVLILVGNGDGTFRPFEPVKAAVALAVADLTGNGARDFVFASQSLNQVTVVYGSTSQAANNAQVVGDQATGVLAPGAVLLADMNGDGIPDLVVANSGGNNVLVYPGLGDGQFGPPVGGTAGFPVGTDPTGLTVADLNGQPDLLVADTGSNDVSVLLGQGSGSSWTMISGARVQTDSGPAAVAVGKLFGSALPALAVANSGADNVQVFPGVGGGFFNDQPQAVKTYAAGQAPSGLFLGDFNGSGTDIAALNAGSNSITVIGPTGQEQTVGTGGAEPTTGFAGDFTGNGFTDLVVGDTADGHLALLMGGDAGLSLSQTITDPAVPEPTGLSFAGVSDGVLSFYATTAGRDAATALAFNLAPEVAPAESGSGPGFVPGLVSGADLAYGPIASAGSALASATAGVFQQVAQLLSANGSTLSLVAPLFTVAVLPSEFEAGAASEGGVALLANFLPGTGPGTAGQGLRPGDADSPEAATDEPAPAGEKANETAAAPPALPVWDRVAMGLERAWELVRSEVLGRAGVADGDNSPPVAAPARPLSPTPAAVRPSTRPPAPERARTIVPVPTPSGPTAGEAASVGVTDAALAELAAEGASDVGPSRPGSAWWVERLAAGRGRLALPVATAAAMASAAAAAGTIPFARNGPRFNRRLSRPAPS